MTFSFNFQRALGKEDSECIGVENISSVLDVF